MHEDPAGVGRRGPHFSGPSAGATLQGCCASRIPNSLGRIRPTCVASAQCGPRRVVARHGARPHRRGRCAACVARQPPGIRQTPGGRRLSAHDCPCWRVKPLLLSNGSPLAVGCARGDHWPDERVALPRGVVVYPRGAEPGLARPARRRRRCLQGRPPVGRAAAAGQPSGVLMASPRTVSGRASAERGRGRSKRAYCGGGRVGGELLIGPTIRGDITSCDLGRGR